MAPEPVDGWEISELSDDEAAALDAGKGDEPACQALADAGPGDDDYAIGLEEGGE